MCPLKPLAIEIDDTRWDAIREHKVVFAKIEIANLNYIFRKPNRSWQFFVWYSLLLSNCRLYLGHDAPSIPAAKSLVRL